MKAHKLIISVSIAILGLLGFFWYREVVYMNMCEEQLKTLSTEICIAIDYNGGRLPNSLPSEQTLQCPKNGLSYRYKRHKERMVNIEEGYGFTVYCPERHCNEALQTVRLSYDASHSNVPIKVLSRD